MSGERVQELREKLRSLAEDADVKQIADVCFDAIEEIIGITKTKIDDIVVIPIIKIIRHRLDIPDND